jgi:lysophospholipase L1-like esterase
VKRKEMKLIIAILLISIALLVGYTGFRFYKITKLVKSEDPTVWESWIEAFEESDRTQMPEPGSILFIGSSSFVFWKTLDADMAPLPVINRGFGGSKIPDLTYYVDRIITPYDPEIIVVYAGDNDMGSGEIKSPQEVLVAYKTLSQKIHSSLPDTPIFFVSIKPSRLRWKRWQAMQEANILIEQHSTTDTHLGYIDISHVMFDAEGNLRKDIFKWDRLHLNKEGYRLWASVIKPILVREYERGIHEKTAFTCDSIDLSAGYLLPAGGRSE